MNSGVPSTFRPIQIDVPGVVRILCTARGRVTVQPCILDVGASFAATVSEFALFPRETARLFVLALKEAFAGSHLGDDRVLVPLPGGFSLVSSHEGIWLRDIESCVVDSWLVSEFAGDVNGAAILRLLGRIDAQVCLLGVAA